MFLKFRFVAALGLVFGLCCQSQAAFAEDVTRSSSRWTGSCKHPAGSSGRRRRATRAGEARRHHRPGRGLAGRRHTGDAGAYDAAFRRRPTPSFKNAALKPGEAHA